ncbi:MAG: hypothetical protein DVB31_06050 [Verrucomicrobia bacterium]|nr:MAG: hypothetical protein DVB31_06050 [Verrucomicrobiota bacterium]
MFDRWPRLTAVVAILAIAGASFLLYSSACTAERRPRGTLWYYNLKTHALFPGPDVAVPPIDTPSGPGTGVRAYVYTSESDPNPTNRFVAFLETLSPETQRAVAADLRDRGGNVPIGFALEKHLDGILVSATDKIEWHPKFGPEGIAIMEAGKAKAGSDRIRPSLP